MDFDHCVTMTKGLDLNHRLLFSTTIITRRFCLSTDENDFILSHLSFSRGMGAKFTSPPFQLPHPHPRPPLEGEELFGLALMAAKGKG
jgi:hypothetical protein